MLSWLGLLLIEAVGIVASLLPIPHAARPLVPAALMATLLAFGFMQLASAPSSARCFAIAGVFWFTVPLGLTIIDPLTRAVYGVTN